MGVIDSLSAIVGASHVLADTAQIAGYAVDYTGRWTTQPLAVVRPSSTEQVASIIQFVAQEKIPVTAQGGNTSLVGGGIGHDGGIILSTARLNSWNIDTNDLTLQAGAGVTLAKAQELAQEHGLLFPINTASRDSATLGGIIATNAGGTRTVRWGATRKHVLGLEVVLGDGSIIRRMRSLHRDNVGYDLPQLFAGSEGTLGIITETLFRLQPKILSSSYVLLIPAQSFQQGNELLTSARGHGFVVEAAEFMTDTGAELVAKTQGIAAPFAGAKRIFLIELSTNDPDPFEQLEKILSTIFTEKDLENIIIESAPAAKLWHLREGHTEAINKKTSTPVIKLDISVPGSKLDEFIDTVPRIVQNFPPAFPICFGHFGEGNVHTNILDSRPEDYAAITTAVFEFVSLLGGSISAEHGIGRAKAAWVSLNRTPADITTMQKIRAALDPYGILAPELLQYND